MPYPQPVPDNFNTPFFTPTPPGAYPTQQFVPTATPMPTPMPTATPFGPQNAGNEPRVYSQSRSYLTGDSPVITIPTGVDAADWATDYIESHPGSPLAISLATNAIIQGQKGQSSQSSGKSGLSTRGQSSAPGTRTSSTTRGVNPGPTSAGKSGKSGTGGATEPSGPRFPGHPANAASVSSDNKISYDAQGYQLDSLGNRAIGSMELDTGKPLTSDYKKLFNMLKSTGLVKWSGSFNNWMAVGMPLAGQYTPDQEAALVAGYRKPYDFNYGQPMGLTPQPGAPGATPGGPPPVPVYFGPNPTPQQPAPAPQPPALPPGTIQPAQAQAGPNDWLMDQYQSRLR